MLLVEVVLFPSFATAAAGGGVFNASATASGARLSLISPGAPASDTPIDGGGPIAEARLDSLGVQQAFASLPYPGDTFLGNASYLPGLVPGAPAPPAYPFYVVANAERPEQTADFGIVHLHAKTEGGRAAAEGGIGMGSAAGRETSRAAAEALSGGAIVARAVQHLEGVVLGPVRIAEAVATAEVNMTPAGVRTRRSSFTVNGMTVGGRPVDLPAGQPWSAPADHVPASTAPAGDSDNPLQPVFDKAGLSVTIIPDHDTDTGVVAGGLEIRTSGVLPNGSSGTLVLVIGQVTAGIAGEPPTVADVGAVIEPSSRTSSLGGDGSPVPTGVTLPGDADRTSRIASVTGPTDPDGAVGPAIAEAAMAPVVPAATPPLPSPVPAAAPAPAALAAAGGELPIDRINRGLYGAVVLGGVAVAALTQLLRLGRQAS
jgi:hypothetical protein